MATLFITEQNSIVRKTSDRLIVEKEGEVLLEVPCLKIETVLIYGNVQVTSQALAEMLDHGIELALLSRSGRLRGQLTPPKAKNMPLRMRQYEVSGSEDFCLGLARSVVAAKIASSAAVLWRFQKNHPDALTDVEIAEVERAAEGIDKVSTLDSLPADSEAARPAPRKGSAPDRAGGGQPADLRPLPRVPGPYREPRHGPDRARRPGRLSSLTTCRTRIMPARKEDLEGRLSE